MVLSSVLLFSILSSAANSCLAADSRNLELLSFTGGTAADLVVQGNYAYVAAENWFWILDISTPSSLKQVSSLYLNQPYNTFIASKVCLSGNHAYVAGYNGMYVINVSNPQNPVKVAEYRQSSIQDICASGNYVYLGVDGRGIQVIDISTPSQPVEAASNTCYPEVKTLFVDNGYLYMGDDHSTLHVYDNSNPLQLVEVGSLYGYSHYDLVVSNGYAYIAGTPHVTSIDVSDPAHPVFKRTLSYSSTYGIHVVAHYVYAAGYYSLQIYDVSDPDNPVARGTCSFSAPLQSVMVVGDHAYVCGERDLYAVNINDPDNPALADTYSVPDPWFSTGDLCIAGNHLYVQDNGLEILDVADPAHPAAIAKFDDPYGNIYSPVTSVDVDGNHAYALFNDWYARTRISIIDISNPASPVETSYFSLTGSVRDIDVADGKAYLAREAYGLSIYSVTNTAQPYELGSCYINSNINELQLQGGYAYIKDIYAGLHIVDVSNPYLAAEAGFLPNHLSYPSSNFYLQGQHAYIGFYALPFYALVIDVANPSQPRQITSYHDPEIPGRFHDVHVDARNYAYFLQYAEPCAAIHILDVSEPQHPVSVAYYKDLPGGVPQVLDVAGDYIYALSEDGLLILRFTPPSPTPAAMALSPKQIKAFNSRMNPNKGEVSTIRWRQPQDGAVSIKIFNLRGELIKTLVDQQTYSSLATNEIVWDGRNGSGDVVANGIYLVHMQAPECRATTKIAVIK